MIGRISEPRRSAARHGAVIAFLGSASASLMAGYAVGHTGLTAEAVVGLVALAALVALALWRPEVVLYVALGALVAIPYYALPDFVGQPIVPAAMLSWFLALALIGRGRLLANGVRLTLVDVGVAALVVSMLLSVVFGARLLGDFFREFIFWIGPYLGFRLLLVRRHYMRGICRGFVLAATALVPFTVYEFVTGANLFRSFANNYVAATVWAPMLSRLNGLRAEASFGHPIALSMFLSTAAVIALGLALTTTSRRIEFAWLGAAASLVTAQAITFSRTGWVIILVALVLLAPWRRGLIRRPEALAALSVAGVLVLAVPQAQSVRDVLSSALGSSTTSPELASASRYRETLLQHALEPRVFRLFGNNVPNFIGSVDNEYIFLTDRFGLVPTACLIAIGIALILELLRRREFSLEAVVLAVTAANLVGLFAVAFITQQQVYIWMLIGCCGAIAQSERRARPVSGTNTEP